MLLVQALKAFYAFSNKLNYEWCGIGTNNWLKIDMAEKRKVNCFGFQRAGLDIFNKMNITGSYDDKEYVFMKECVIENNVNGIHYFELDDLVDYRYYRFDITEGRNAINKVYLYLEDSALDKTSKCDHGMASSRYTLPMNTTLNILNKTNDSREGLLGMANDNDNYGSLYVVGKDGGSHLTMSGIKSEIIFEGTANVLNQSYLLLKSINNFKFIILYNNGSYSGETREGSGIILSTDKLIEKYSTKYALSISAAANSSNIETMLHFNNDKEFTIDQIYNKNWINNGIYKIIGIY